MKNMLAGGGEIRAKWDGSLSPLIKQTSGVPPMLFERPANIILTNNMKLWLQ
jgi:hypothetical protein